VVGWQGGHAAAGLLEGLQAVAPAGQPKILTAHLWPPRLPYPRPSRLPAACMGLRAVG
jgi:hypothetical protein